MQGRDLLVQWNTWLTVFCTWLTFCWSIRRILEGQELGNQAMTNFFQIPFLFPNAEKDRNF